MKAPGWFGGIAAIALLAVALWPLTHALPPGDALAGRIAASLVCAILCLAFALTRNSLPGDSRLWIALAAVGMAAALAVLMAHDSAKSSCIALYESRPKIIGRELQPWVHPEPGATKSSLLFDAAGSPEMAWTPASIRKCRWLVGWVGLGAMPLFVLSACCLVQAGRRRFVVPPPASREVPRANEPGVFRFDAFFSYRHGEPDRGFALEVLNALEERGFRCAIDERDFSPNEHFLSEMERCVKESRFVLCVVTARYIASEHCVEEAVIGKTLDMAQRTRRVVPLIFEPVELPVWLHGIVGVDFTQTAGVDPLERMLTMLETRAR